MTAPQYDYLPQVVGFEASTLSNETVRRRVAEIVPLTELTPYRPHLVRVIRYIPEAFSRAAAGGIQLTESGYRGRNHLRVHLVLRDNLPARLQQGDWTQASHWVAGDDATGDRIDIYSTGGSDVLDHSILNAFGRSAWWRLDSLQRSEWQAIHHRSEEFLGRVALQSAELDFAECFAVYVQRPGVIFQPIFNKNLQLI